MKYLYVLLVVGCSIPMSKIGKQDVILDCPKWKEQLQQYNSYCDKLNFYDTSSTANVCYEDFLYEIADITGYGPHVALGPVGAYYSSDSLYRKDLQVWRDFFKCDQQNQQKNGNGIWLKFVMFSIFLSNCKPHLALGYCRCA